MKVTLMALFFGFFLAAGLPLAAMAGPTSSADTDLDGVQDAFDNCAAISNTSQADDDKDGCGNPCDGKDPYEGTNPTTGFFATPDVSGDSVIGFPDFAIVSGDWLANTQPGPPPPGDATGDTITGFPDFAAISGGWLAFSGASGLTNPGRIPPRCYGPGGPGT